MSFQSQTGTNRTGLQASPDDAKKLLDAERKLAPQYEGDPADFAEIKVLSIGEADPLGSVPQPVWVEGTLKAGMRRTAGVKPQVFIDKLAERAAFERTGTRLYDALILKYQAAGDTTSGATLDALTQIRAEELAHFHLLMQAIRSLGGDPTAQTPSANIVGIEASGLMQVLNDPRTTFTECLNAILMAELADVDAWALLANLAEGAGEDQLAARFRDALLQENQHLQRIRSWYHQGVMA